MRKPSSLTFISGHINNTRLSCLVDTGATHSFIDLSVVRRLPNASITDSREQFTLADGNTTINIVGTVTLSMKIRHITTTIVALIAKSLSYPCILGQDWLNKYSVDICQSTKQIKIYTTESMITVPIDHRFDDHQFNLKSVHAIFIPPRHECTVELRAPISSTSGVIFHPARSVQLHNRVAIPHALLSIDNHRTFITVANPTNRIRRIPVNTTLGTFVIPTVHIECHSIRSPNSTDQQMPSSPSSTRSPVSGLAKDNFDTLVDHVVDPNQRTLICQLLTRHQRLFDTSVPSISNLTAPPMINTGSHSPVHARVYRTDPMKQKHLKETIDEMLTHGQIEKSYASWSSPVMLVKKKDGSFRFVVDYRHLNSITERDCYPLPRIDDTLNRLNGNNYFTKLDLKTGYHQIRIHPTDKDKTTFVTSHGAFRFHVMPQGLTNSPSNFQRLMYDLLVNNRWEYSLVYLDDVLIFSRTFDEHLSHLEDILSALSSANLQLNTQKCSFVRSEIDYLGHTINGQGIRPLQSNVDAILKLPRPCTPKQVHCFVQAANYYREHIENFSKLAAPLFPYTTKNAVWTGWTDAMDKAFLELRRRLTTAPVFLNFPEDDGQFILSTDASGEGMGGVLRQSTSNGLKVIKYISKRFNSAQKRYSTTERECLAMVWCIQKVKEYIWGRPIEIETDHCPLCSFNKKRFNNSRIDRWQVELSEYDIRKITYKRGQCNCDADLLSRFPSDDEHNDDDDRIMPLRNRPFNTKPSSPIDLIQANVITRSKAKAMQPRPLPSPPSTSSSLPPATGDDPLINHRTIDLSMDRIRIAQAEDTDLSQRISSVQDKPDEHPNEVVENGILFKKISHVDGTTSKVPWLPSSLIPDVLFLYHDHPMSGHLGISRTFHKIRDQLFFHRMHDHIKRYIRSCVPCTQCNAQRRKKPGFLQRETPPEGVFEVMQMDYWKAPVRSSQDNQYVLVVTDRLSKFVFARAFPSATSTSAAEMLFEDIILKHGGIRYLQSDQGSHFRNELLSAITKMTGCEQALSIPYHPMSNGQVERFNSTFCDQLKKYCHQNPSHWDLYLSSVVWAYNSTIHATTKYIPYELAFNRRPRYPFDPVPSTITFAKPNDYWERANRFKSIALQSARNNIVRQQQISKDRYDRNRRQPTYNPGDLVWVKHSIGQSKLDTRFDGPFVIVDRLSDVKYLVEHTELGYRRYDHINNLISFYDL
jgi:predicted aspartyl protease